MLTILSFAQNSQPRTASLTHRNPHRLRHNLDPLPHPQLHIATRRTAHPVEHHHTIQPSVLNAGTIQDQLTSNRTSIAIPFSLSLFLSFSLPHLSRTFYLSLSASSSCHSYLPFFPFVSFFLTISLTIFLLFFHSPISSFSSLSFLFNNPKTLVS